MKLGIIILTWNSINHIDKCLSTLFLKCEGAKTMHNIYIVDNGSNDNTIEFLRKNYPEITLICNFYNLGFASGNNVGIKKALEDGCDFVLLLNDDVYFVEDCITPCLKIISSKNNVGAIGPVVVEGYDNNIVQSQGGKINYWTLSMPYIKKGKYYSKVDQTSDVDYILGAAIMFRIKNVNYLPFLESSYYPAYVEEVDLCCRISKEGLRNIIYEGTRIAHVGGQSAGNLSKQYRRIALNKILFAFLNLNILQTIVSTQYILLKYYINILIKRKEKV